MAGIVMPPTASATMKSRQGEPGVGAKLAVLGMLAFLVILGLAANGRTLPQSLIALAFLGSLLGAAWLAQWTRKRCIPWSQLSAHQRTWQIAELLVFVTALAALLWWSSELHPACTEQPIPKASGRDPTSRGHEK